jgi:hypothetical protein
MNEETSELRRMVALLSAAEVERIDLKRRYVELGERIERLLESDGQRNAAEMLSLREQNQEITERLQTAEFNRQTQDDENASLLGKLASTSKALEQGEEKVLTIRLSLATLPAELSSLKTELFTLGNQLREEKMILSQKPSGKEPVHSADIPAALAQALGVAFTDDDLSDTTILALKIRDAVDVRLDLVTYTLRAEFIQLRQETVALREAWAAERAETELELVRLRSAVPRLSLGNDEGFELSRLSRECQRLKDLLNSRDTQLNQLIESRQSQLRISFSSN